MSEIVESASVQEFKKISYGKFPYNIKFMRPSSNYLISEDKQTLIVKNYYINGVLEFEDTYNVFEIEADSFVKAGPCYLINGISRTYDKNGVISTENTYVKGKLQGDTKLYDKYANNTEELIYENDILVTHNYYSQDKELTLTRAYKDGKLDYMIHYVKSYPLGVVEKKIYKQIYEDGKIVKTIEMDSE